MDFVISLKILFLIVLATLRQHSQLQPRKLSKTILSVKKNDLPDDEPNRRRISARIEVYS